MKVVAKVLLVVVALVALVAILGVGIMIGSSSSGVKRVGRALIAGVESAMASGVESKQVATEVPPSYENEDGPGSGYDAKSDPYNPGGDSGEGQASTSSGDITSLSGVYEVDLKPDDSERRSMTLRLVFNIHSQNGNDIPFDVSMVDANGTSFNARTGYAHFNIPSGSMNFMFTCQAMLDVFEFQGVLTPVSLQGTYKETNDITGFSGQPTPHPGTFSGHKVF